MGAKRDGRGRPPTTGLYGRCRELIMLGTHSDQEIFALLAFEFGLPPRRYRMISHVRCQLTKRIGKMSLENPDGVPPRVPNFGAALEMARKLICQ